ncbi:MAG: hypothetical protein JAY67_17045 [Candidatus Thiodiazotropha taylori]|nr:hypothetical protein [Candidatus Thiodiazotropha taylori]
MALDEALERAIKVYEKEQRHPAPTDVVAQDMGYKNANSGASLKTIAALTNYGLLERAGPGKLAVSADVQSYHYAPDPALKEKLLINWLKSPAVFAKLLDKYKKSLPSDSTIRFDLIEEGFKPGTAESVLNSFKRSVEFAGYFSAQHGSTSLENESSEYEEELSDNLNLISKTEQRTKDQLSRSESYSDFDRIPVRLDSKRRAWLEIPTPFYDKDKDRLKAQINLLITDDENENLEDI